MHRNSIANASSTMIEASCSTQRDGSSYSTPFEFARPEFFQTRSTHARTRHRVSRDRLNGSDTTTGEGPQTPAQRRAEPNHARTTNRIPLRSSSGQPSFDRSSTSYAPPNSRARNSVRSRTCSTNSVQRTPEGLVPVATGSMRTPSAESATTDWCNSFTPPKNETTGRMALPLFASTGPTTNCHFRRHR